MKSHPIKDGTLTLELGMEDAPVAQMIADMLAEKYVAVNESWLCGNTLPPRSWKNVFQIAKMLKDAAISLGAPDYYGQ